MLFEPLHYGDRLRLINPAGDVGVTTLWSRVDQVLAMLADAGIDLDPASSRIAAVGNLYGNGLPHMLRNLLWNPQIAHLLALGQNLSGSREDLAQFFAAGLEAVEFLGAPSFRIVGTNRVIDGLVTPAHYRRKPKLTLLGKPAEEATRQGAAAFFRALPPLDASEIERVDIPLPMAEIARFPSEPRAHAILRDTPLEAWEELIFRLVRFGHRSRLKKGERIELQNMKVVVERPEEDADERLEELGFDPAHFREYQEKILNPLKPADLEYTYGNRMRGYYAHEGRVVDTLAEVIERLRADPESRHAYLSLWDTARDTVEGRGCPCLVSLFFRRFEGRLTLTATFRTHNAVDAWPENVWGLIAIQRHAASALGMERGPLTVFSHSISVSADALDKAKRVAEGKKSDEMRDPVTGKRMPRMDYNGEFIVTVDETADEIVVQHSYQGAPLSEYRGKRAEQLEKQLARDCAISEISHALYLGREIARAELRLRRATGSKTETP
jgi:thymidylate synthase